MMKTYFLRHKTFQSLEEVEAKVAFFLKEHNEVIPKSQLQGATPREVYLNHWTAFEIQKIKNDLNLAAEKRRKDFVSISCKECSGPTAGAQISG